MAHLVAHRDTASRSEDMLSFLAEARRNLRLMRHLDGSRGPRYRRLVRHYRAVADDLACRRPLERLLHPLRFRRPRPHGPTPP